MRIVKFYAGIVDTGYTIVDLPIHSSCQSVRIELNKRFNTLTNDYLVLLVKSSEVKLWLDDANVLSNYGVDDGMALVLYPPNYVENLTQLYYQESANLIRNNCPIERMSSGYNSNFSSRRSSVGEFDSLNGVDANLSSVYVDPSIVISSNINDYSSGLGYGQFQAQHGSTFITESTTESGYLIYICDGFEGVATAPVKMLPTYDYDQVLRIALEKTKLPNNQEYLLCMEIGNMLNIFQRNQCIDSFSCYDRMKLYIIPKYSRIKIYAKDSFPHHLDIDITADISKLNTRKLKYRYLSQPLKAISNCSNIRSACTTSVAQKAF